MNREALQRAEELDYTTRFFRRHFEIAPDFESLPTNSRPDVCVSLDGRRIGIELTRIVDESQAAFDTFAASLLKAARDRFAQLGDRPGTVMVLLKPAFVIKGLNARELGVELAQLVASLWPDHSKRLVIEPMKLPPALARFVTSVSAYSSVASTGTHWQSPVAAWVRGITVDLLQPIIDRKANELSAYREMGCDEYWLLIYARVGKSAEMLDEAQGFDRHALISPFDRTFYYDAWRTIELASAR